MATFLFDDIVFGPIKSRRLGNSLGVNLLPLNAKICSFNCGYCECGWNDSKGQKFPKYEDILSRLDEGIRQCKDKNIAVDVITFAGNGEPTMHPDFDKIVDAVIELRNKYLPEAKIAVLTNAFYLHKQSVVNALQKIDMAILKLDSAIERTVKIVNKPVASFQFQRYLENLRNFPGRKIIQTMFLKYKSNGVEIDNTGEEELSAWFDELARIKPDLVMIYSVARDTPDSNIEPHSRETLEKIARRMRNYGYKVEVS